MSLSNVVLVQYTTLERPKTLHTAYADGVTATTADLHVTAIEDTGTTYWAVFDKPGTKNPPDIINPVGAIDSGNAPAQLTEDDFQATGLDTTTKRYYAYFAHTDSLFAIPTNSFGTTPSSTGGDQMVDKSVKPYIVSSVRKFIV